MTKTLDATGCGSTREGAMTLSGPITFPPAVSSKKEDFRSHLRLFAAEIKLSHSVFALPFVLLGGALAGVERVGGLRAGHLVLMVLCAVFARTAAMAANRLLDADLDAGNPRTSGRAVASGRLSRPFVGGMLGVASASFVTATGGFWWAYSNPWPLAFGVPVLVFLCIYPLLKRFTWLCHYYLGVALALAPICASVAVLGDVPAAVWAIAAGVWLWTAGFDVIYATLDARHDAATGVYSLPGRFGIRRALMVARLSHVGAIAAFAAAGWLSPHLDGLWGVGVVIAAALLLTEHLLVRANDLSRVGVAFFTFNGLLSLVLGGVGMIDVFA